ncbi:hypothetical protein O9X98_14465 [Agrobacterium salinitolerans]|nr:hypothetical protein [Agrobacterium salinitolerans]
MAILRAIIFSVGVLISGTAYAAEKCYEDVPVAASFDCAKNNSKSADFSSGCQFNPATTKKVEVDCPGRWVNIKAATVGSSSPTPTQSEVCKSKGLNSAKIGGMFCASGERRPMVGGDWALIDYKYGKKGDGNGFDGGNDLDTRVYTVDTCGKDCENYVTRYSLYCYDNKTGTKNNTSEDAAVAFYCQ